MTGYNVLARYYDYLTQNVEYESRCKYIEGFFSEYSDGKKLLDLACGTGTMCKFFADSGYDVSGVDISDDMLCIADEKCRGSVRLFRGDITEFSLDGDFDCCICALDSINHLESIDAVKRCFNNVYESLKPGGVFVFDVNTIHKHSVTLGSNTFAFDENDFFLCWDNEYEGDGRVRILLDFFIFNGKNYDRESEEFYETAYDISTLKDALVGFDIIGVFDDMSYNMPTEQSDRIYFVCKRK